VSDPGDEFVTVIRLVPLGRAEPTGPESAIVASFARANLRAAVGDSIFLVARDDSTIRRIKVGDVVQWVAQPFGVVWLAEQQADPGAGVQR
jgi:hypothetical protein